MTTKDETREWWTQTLLNESKSAHPVFGTDIQAKIEGDTAVLTGVVSSADEAEEIEREALSIDFIQYVVNDLTVERDPTDIYHMQTVIAVFPNGEAAKLACQAIASAKIYGSDPPQTLHPGERAEQILRERARASKVGKGGIERYLDALSHGKVLLVDRVPEDEALRIISTLEGSNAELIETLPPEPDSVEEE